MKAKIENVELFREKLRTGICFFTGAGFSTLPDKDGKKLPTATILAKEIAQKFDVDDTFDDDLSYIAEQCPPNELDDYLREKFTITSYNPLYSVLNKIRIKTFVTTNIDNIVRKVINDGNTYYINNIREYGAPTYNPYELTYIPLHGDVLDKNSTLYFKKLELTQVTTENKDLFDTMYAHLVKQAVLFIGYSFNDGGVMEVITKLLKNGCHDIWVQCLPSDKKNIAFFHNKGCNIIESDTESLLKWIEDQGNLINVSDDSRSTNISELKRYQIPSLTDIPAVQNTEYFQQGNTHWYPILVNVPYERKEVNQVYNEALKFKNVIIIGDRFTGKTTMLMQSALKVNAEIKLYIDTPRLEEAKFICKNLEKDTAWIFVQNCTADIEAFKLLASQQNLYVVGTSNDYQYETVRHLIDNEVKYRVVNISELTKSEALAIFNKIPKGLKNNQFKYKDAKHSNDKYSMLEFVGLNVSKSLSKRKISFMLHEILESDYRIFDIIALTAYLSENYSALSYDIVASYFNILVYPNAYELVKKAQEHLKSYYYDNLEMYEDYYILRSKLFATNTKDLLLKEFKEQYSKVVEKFIKNVSTYSILRYDIFRRKGYDAELFYRLFSYEKSNDLFEFLFENNSNCYTLQQWALCRMKFAHYKEAFADIDRALSIAPNNFSIQNSQAIILFEANKNDHSEIALKSLKEAMGILQECYKNDKRKIYHAQKFAEFALILKRTHNCSDYILEATNWLNEISNEQGENITQKTKDLLHKLKVS